MLGMEKNAEAAHAAGRPPDTIAHAVPRARPCQVAAARTRIHDRRYAPRVCRLPTRTITQPGSPARPTGRRKP